MWLQKQHTSSAHSPNLTAHDGPLNCESSLYVMLMGSPDMAHYVSMMPTHKSALSSFGICLFSSSTCFPSTWQLSMTHRTVQLSHLQVRHAAKHSTPPKNLFVGDEGKLTVGILPTSIFASGHMFFVQVCVGVCVGWRVEGVGGKGPVGLSRLGRPSQLMFVGRVYLIVVCRQLVDTSFATHPNASHCLRCTQKKYAELKLQPYVAHATFQYSGTPGKRNRFREFMHWWDPPEYYDSPNGFLSFE